MSHAYRSAYQHIVGMRLAELKAARESLEPHLPRLRSVHGARIARIAAGAVGIGGAVATVASACAGDAAEPTYVLVGSAAAIPATYVVVRGLAAIGGLFARAPAPAPRLTGDLETDLARIEASDLLRPVERRLAGLESWSAALPLAALSLLMPLTLHWLFCLFTAESPRSFATWMRISMVIVGHAHLALMALAIGFACKMARSTSEALGAMPVHREWAKAWGITIVVSAVPGLVLLAIPPLLTALTGLAFIPFMYVLMRRQLMKERAALELAEESVHTRVDDGAAVLEAGAWHEVAACEERAETARV